jgi:hypothetical protein
LKVRQSFKLSTKIISLGSGNILLLITWHGTLCAHFAISRHLNRGLDARCSSHISSR